jgi:hemerythrin
MSVGNDAIDHDHRYLVCYLNTVELALQNPEEKEVLLSSLQQLYNYAYEHFMKEEIIQQKISYPEIQKHRIEHKKLLEDLSKMKNNLETKYDKQDINNRYEEIVAFLRHWLIDHVLNTDMLLKPYLSKHPKHLS